MSAKRVLGNGFTPMTEDCPSQTEHTALKHLEAEKSPKEKPKEIQDSTYQPPSSENKEWGILATGNNVCFIVTENNSNDWRSQRRSQREQEYVSQVLKEKSGHPRPLEYISVVKGKSRCSQVT